MDLDQMIKKLEWLDDERRKDKTALASLVERQERAEATLLTLNQQVKEYSGEITRISAMLGRFTQIDEALSQMRVEIVRMIEDIQRQRNEQAREVEKNRLADLENFSKSIGELRKALEVLPDFKRDLLSRQEEDFRLGRLIEELEKRLEESIRGDEEYRRSLRLLEEGRRQDAKRLLDVQNEANAVRKRVDEQRGKLDLLSDNIRKYDLRIGELQSADAERRQTQTAFIEKQTVAQLERERVWKEWQERFESFLSQTVDIDSHIATLDATLRAVKRSQEGFDEVSQRFERRINEITEMARLNEERFRQEWTDFKGDDQKRWTNYTLSQEELMREATRRYEKFTERFARLEDTSQELQDVLYQVVEDIQKQTQGMLNLARETMENYERSYGRFKK